MKKTIVLLALLGSAGLVCAQGNNFYAIGGIGQSNVKLKDEAGPVLVDLGATGVSSSVDKKDTAWKLGVGYQLSPNFAVEAGYVALGKVSNKARGTGGADTANAEYKSSALGLSALGMLPINTDFSVFAKAGVAHTKITAKADLTVGGASASDSAKKREFVPVFGLGAEYKLTQAVAVRAEYERYFKVGDKNTTGESDVDFLSLGVKVGF